MGVNSYKQNKNDFGNSFKITMQIQMKGCDAMLYKEETDKNT